MEASSLQFGGLEAHLPTRSQRYELFTPKTLNKPSPRTAKLTPRTLEIEKLKSRKVEESKSRKVEKILSG